MNILSPEQVGDKARQSAKWCFSLHFFHKIVFFICGIILARILTPEDFGLAAISITLDLLTWFVMSFGINAAIVHFQDNMEKRLNAAFWMFLIFTSLLSLGLIVCASLIAEFYSAPIVVHIIIFSAVAFFIQGFGLVHKAILFREMDFKKISILDSSVETLRNISFVVLAFSGFRVWSFIYPKIFIALISVVCLWKMTGWIPKKEFNFKYWPDMFKYSKNVFLGNILDFILNNSTHVLIGGMVGPAALGLYSFANDKSMMMINNVAYPTSMVSFPAYTKLRDHTEKLKEAFISTIKSLSLVTFPYTTGQITLVREYVICFYGSKWEPAVLVFQMLLIYTMIKSVSYAGNALLQGIGRPDIVFKWNLFYIPVLLSAIFIGNKAGGIYGIGALISVCGSFMALGYLVVIFKVLKWSLVSLFEILLPSLASSVIMASILVMLKAYLKFQNFSDFLIFFILAITGILIYFPLLKLTFPGTFNFVFQNIVKLTGRNNSQYRVIDDKNDKGAFEKKTETLQS